MTKKQRFWLAMAVNFGIGLAIHKAAFAIGMRIWDGPGEWDAWKWYFLPGFVAVAYPLVAIVCWPLWKWMTASMAAYLHGEEKDDAIEQSAQGGV